MTYSIMLKHWCLNFIPVFLISSYGAQLALYLALHSSLFGPDGAVNYDYIFTNTITYLAQGVFPM